MTGVLTEGAIRTQTSTAWGHRGKTAVWSPAEGRGRSRPCRRLDLGRPACRTAGGAISARAPCAALRCSSAAGAHGRGSRRRACAGVRPAACVRLACPWPSPTPRPRETLRTESAASDDVALHGTSCPPSPPHLLWVCGAGSWCLPRLPASGLPPGL